MGSALRAWLADNAVSIGVGLTVGAAVVALGALRPSPPAIEVRPREPQATAVTYLYVHVDGAVLSPGVYPMPSGGRVFEAIDVAGGAAADADLSELNLAARVSDGQKLVVPRYGPPAVAADPASEGPAAGNSQPASARTSSPPFPGTTAAARINLNTATGRMLETLPGIGPVIAGRIVDYRQTNGPFQRVEQLRDARLVNATTFERIKTFITVD